MLLWNSKRSTAAAGLYAAASLMAPATAQATVLIDDLTPGLNGWEVSGSVNTSTNYRHMMQDPTQYLTDGNGDVVLNDQGQPVVANYTYTDLYNYTPVNAPEDPAIAVLHAGQENVYTTLSRTFQLTRAGTIGFSYAFAANDYVDPTGQIYFDVPGSYNDDAFITLQGLDEPSILQVSVSQVGNFGWLGKPQNQAEGWRSFWSDLGPGAYTITFGVRNVGDDQNSSKLLVDAFQVTQAVPEPATWVMLIGGFYALGAALRLNGRRAAA